LTGKPIKTNATPSIASYSSHHARGTCVKQRNMGEILEGENRREKFQVVGNATIRISKRNHGEWVQAKGIDHGGIRRNGIATVKPQRRRPLTGAVRTTYEAWNTKAAKRGTDKKIQSGLTGQNPENRQ
jgi:hypothetical protein